MSARRPAPFQVFVYAAGVTPAGGADGVIVEWPEQIIDAKTLREARAAAAGERATGRTVRVFRTVHVRWFPDPRMRYYDSDLELVPDPEVRR